MPIIDGETKRTDYENFVATCPHCGKENIFNRISDLNTIEPIAFKVVRCFNCNEEFNIRSDNIGENYEYLINDCLELIKLKRYMYCVLNLGQACEAFFLYGVEIKLIWEPWKSGIFDRDIDVLNGYLEQLYDKTKSYTYSKMLNIFFDIFLNNKTFNSRQDIDDYLNQIQNFAGNNPTIQEIQNYPAGPKRDLMLDLKRLDIHEMRNKVVHKYVFRPSRQDVEGYLESVRRILIGLSHRLNLRHRIMYQN